MRPRVWITAGGTSEPIDGVRAVTNSSTGRFGSAIARAFVRRGAEVTLIGSRAMLRHPEWTPGATTVPYGSAADLDQAITRCLEDHGAPDVFLMASAVADYSPVPASGKIRSTLDTLDVHMRRTPKILSTLRARCGTKTTLVGFKLLVGVSEEELASVADAQRTKNELDYVVANDLHHLKDGRHPILLVDGDGHRAVEGMRDDVADALADVLLPPAVDPELPAATLPTAGRARVWWRVRTPHHDSILRAEDQAHAVSLLARCAPSLTRPIQIAVRDEVWLGGAAHDRAEFAATVRRLASQHGPGVPVLANAHVIGWMGSALHLEQPEDALYTLQEDRVPATDNPLEPFGVDLEDGTLVMPWAKEHRIAASVCLVDTQTREVLLGRRKTPPIGNLSFPGGRVESGETPWQAAKRELAEETGIQLTGQPRRVEVTWVRGPTAVWKVHCHIVETFARPAPTTTPELESMWVPLNQAASLRPKTPGVNRILRHLPTLLRLGPR